MDLETIEKLLQLPSIKVRGAEIGKDQIIKNISRIESPNLASTVKVSGPYLPICI